MLFVNDDQTQVVILEIRIQEFVGPNQNIDVAGTTARADGVGFLLTALSRNYVDADWPARESISK